MDLSELNSNIISIPTWEREYGQLKAAIISVGDTCDTPEVTKEKAQELLNWIRGNTPIYFYEVFLQEARQENLEDLEVD